MLNTICGLHFTLTISKIKEYHACFRATRTGYIHTLRRIAVLCLIGVTATLNRKAFNFNLSQIIQDSIAAFSCDKYKRWLSATIPDAYQRIYYPWLTMLFSFRCLANPIVTSWLRTSAGINELSASVAALALLTPAEMATVQQVWNQNNHTQLRK
ncbi:MAG: hypothetical protein IPP36_06100 [Nitrosomonadales bacterium]|nr:hypothetical protein [Nitrosomonadales bacterium]